MFDEEEGGEPTGTRADAHIGRVPVSRANPSQLRAAVRELLMSVTCGPKSPECFARLSPGGSWVKMSGGYSLFPTEESSGTFSGTWPTWGIALDGAAMAQTKPLGLPTEGTGCSSLDTWATPRAGQSAGSNEVEWTPGKKPTVNGVPITTSLTDQVNTWRTPSAGDAEGGIMDIALAERMGYNPKIKLRDHTPEAMEKWPTPSAFDANDVPDGNREARKAAGGCRNLAQEGPTFSLPAPQTQTDGENSLAQDQTSLPPSRLKRRLNYRFVNALQGFPEGWLD